MLAAFFAVEGLAGHDVVQRVALSHGICHGLGDVAAGNDAPVDFRQTELGVVRRDGEVAGGERGEGTAEYPAIDHGDGRLGVEAQLDLLPGRCLFTDAHLEGVTLVIGLAEVLLQIHACRPGSTAPGQDHHLAARIEFQGMQRGVHLPIERGAHAVFLVGAIEVHEGDVVAEFDVDGIAPGGCGIGHDGLPALL